MVNVTEDWQYVMLSVTFLRRLHAMMRDRENWSCHEVGARSLPWSIEASDLVPLLQSMKKRWHWQTEANQTDQWNKWSYELAGNMFIQVITCRRLVCAPFSSFAQPQRDMCWLHRLLHHSK